VTGTTGATGATGATGIVGGFAYFYSQGTQVGISPGAVVELHTRDSNSTSGLTSSANFGVTIATSGIYQIYYSVLPSQTTSVVLNSFMFGNIGSTIFGNDADNTQISGTVIVSLTGGDTITIINNDSSQTWQTRQTTGQEGAGPIPVEFIILRLQ
jgi:hypothetical protein